MKFFTFGLGDDSEPIDLSHPLTPVQLLGGKGAGLVWMSKQGIPVPPGFVIPVTVWTEYDKKPKTTIKEIAKALPLYLEQLKAHFGYMPLLSVRSGARVSCPGMMDTILNVGIGGAAERQGEWRDRLGETCFNDSLHRLVMMYGSVVKGIRREELVTSLPEAMDEYMRQTGEHFPDTKEQLLRSIEAVFKSWDNDRAKEYRTINRIPREWGTAVTIQAMVFGNLNAQSGTGVLFTRNPNTGVMAVTGEFLQQAQGEDVVAGIRTPVPLSEMQTWNPTVYDELLQHVLNLENLKKDAQDVEFTVQDGKLFILQTRDAKRTPTAAIKIAIDMVKQGLIDAKTAARRVSIQAFDHAQVAHVDPTFTKPETFKGIAACNGVVTGKPVFTKEEAINCKEACILVTPETNPDDIAGIKAAVGVITMVGGFTSHAAIVARGFNRACIVGVGQTVAAFKDVEVLSMDGLTGKIWTEAIPIIKGQTNGLISEFTQLVFDALQAVPVIDRVPMVHLPEALLYLGAGVLNPEAMVKMVLEAVKQVDRLYVDLLPEPGSPEAEFMALVAHGNHVQRVVDQLELAALKHKELAAKLVLVGNVTTVFQTVAEVTDLKSLVLAGKEVLTHGIDLKDPAVNKVMLWKAKEGLKVVSLGLYVKGLKSMLSVSQAMQAVQEGGV